MDIYPARELPIPGVDADIILKNVTSSVKVRSTNEELMQRVEDADVDVLVTVGAGDIDTFVEPIRKLLLKKYEA